jgi:DNA-binding CsgD family transcriptional regulator
VATIFVVIWSRDEEMAAIGRLIDSARAGRGGGLIVRGEPGIGKSALLGYAHDQAEGMRVLSAAGAQAESALGYAVLHQLLRPVLPAVSKLPVPQAAALNIALGLTGGEPPDRFLVSLAGLTLLSDLAAERPVLCLVDDVQWSDRPSVEAIAFLARRLAAEPIALLAADRAEEGVELTGTGMAQLRLAGLDPGAAAAFLGQRSGTRLAPAVREALVRACGGNPLALMELPGMLTAGQLAGREPLPEPLPLAGELERAFAEQMQPLEPDLRALALLCAAEGSGCLAVIRRAAAELGIAADVKLEQLSGVRVHGPAVVFRHPLLRSAVYHGATPAERRAAHRALADALADVEAETDRHAWHLAGAACGPDERAAAELEGSAARTLRRSGHAAAAAALERAADLSLADGPQARRLAAAADAAWRGGDSPRAQALLDRAERIVPLDPVVRLQVRYLRGVIQVRSGIPADGLALLLPAAAEAVTADPHLALLMLNAAGEAAFQAGQDESRVGRLAAALPDTIDPGEDLVRRLFLSVRQLFQPANPAGREDEARHPMPDLSGLEDVDDPDLLARAGGMASSLGRLALARRLRRKAVARSRALGAAGTLASTLLSMAYDEFTWGRYALAEAYAAEGHSLAVETGQPNLACQHQALLAEIAGVRGRAPQARRLALETLAEATGRGLHGTAALARRALAELALATNRPAEALGHLEAQWTNDAAAHRVVALTAVPDLVEAAVRAGRPEAGARRLPAYLAWADSAGSAEARALAARSQALLAADGEADRLFQEAVQAHAATEQPLERSRTALLYGEHLSRQRRRTDAREFLAAALDTFEGHGAACWAARARAELRATGETVRELVPAALDRLTPRELQVARAIGHGATNREAAAALFIGPRTVDHHLRSVFRKLEISSRGELIRLMVTANALE